MTEPTTTAPPKTTYETSGERPNRTIVKSEDGEQVLLMTEIGESSFVAATNCGKCRNRVARCVCVGGPSAAHYVEVWRQELITGRKKPDAGDPPEYQHDDEPSEADEPEVDPGVSAAVDAGLDAARAAVEQRRDLSDIDPGF